MSNLSFLLHGSPAAAAFFATALYKTAQMLYNVKSKTILLNLFLEENIYVYHLSRP